MLGVNKVVLLGWVGQDPELRYTASQRPIVTLRMATNRYHYDDQGQRQKMVDWHTVVFSNQLAEFCAQKISKGSRVFIEGLLEYQSRVHREFKAVKWKEAIVVAQRLQIIDGMLEHEYPDDFPELSAIKQRKSAASTKAKKHSDKPAKTTPSKITQKAELKQPRSDDDLFTDY